MTIESMLNRESTRGYYRFTVSGIDQRDWLCLHSLHGGIFGV